MTSSAKLFCFWRQRFSWLQAGLNHLKKQQLVLVFTMAAKRKLPAMVPQVEEPVDPADELMFLCLGGGNEVGRSCHIIQYKGKTIMVCTLNNYPRALDKSLTICHSWMQGNTLPMMALRRCHTSTSSI